MDWDKNFTEIPFTMPYITLQGANSNSTIRLQPATPVTELSVRDEGEGKGVRGLGTLISCLAGVAQGSLTETKRRLDYDSLQQFHYVYPRTLIAAGITRKGFLL